MKEILAYDKDAKTCLYHRGKVVMLDKVLSCSQTEIFTKMLIKQDNAFLKSYQDTKVFPMYKSVEIMAQSLGCYQKILQSHQAAMECEPKIGFLIGVRNFMIKKPYVAIGQELFTCATLSLQDESGFGVYDCEIFLDEVKEESVAKATLSVLSVQTKFEEWIKNAK